MPRGLLAFCLLWLVFSESASAQSLSNPMRHADRPIALPEADVRLDVGALLSIRDIPASGWQPAAFALVGFGFGLVEDIELGGVLLTQRLTDEFQLHNPSAYLKYRWWRKTVQLAWRLDALLPVTQRLSTQGSQIPLQPYRGDLALGIDSRWNVASILRLDFGVSLGLEDSHSWRNHFVMPYSVVFNLSEPVALGLAGAIAVRDFAFSTWPLGAVLILSLGEKFRHVVDFRVQAGWYNVARPQDDFLASLFVNAFLPW